ncbi:hypothetical protein ASPSYDRAFT_61474 [Aspergillus sydowii CBS 593.65]|uniref:Arginosuccinase n=1 Tax=Aspergillus sydowii CBS 593.65 TaxID=1036612 RepID=A0A1L9T3W2_9EURO|nr:uncharacterized protein ASPSYDRAFT_61474 [Aspergillus sydowii CBS 593.65]OJJ54140.1 hypothetical protein ASPSYDRAFT_61474 [Aspergillus sydowii CBS 593.65]
MAAHRSLTETRLGTRASRLLVTHVNKVELDDELVSLDEYVLTDLAHAVMLTQTGIFDAQHGHSIVRALLDLRAGDTAAILASNPEVGTLGLQIEQYLEKVLGPRGRDIQRGRSRIDQKATNWRLVVRASLVEVMGELLCLGSQILATAERYAGALMPGYTHLQHSQPTTIDHYLNAHYWAVSRNFARLVDAYDRLNISPLGTAAYSGTSWPIDRATTAFYLGFDRPIPNARDGGFASLDMGAEIASVLAATLSGISRLASDLSYWSSSEVALVRIDASLCGTSSMMPQKRNPMVLERIRGLAGAAVGWAASQYGVMHTATSTDADQSYVVATVEFDVPAMRISAGKHWSTASALADALVTSHNLSFREAHESVAHLVAAHERGQIPGGELRTELITDKSLSAYPSSKVKRILDPEAFVASRTSQGGTCAAQRDALSSAALADWEECREKLQVRSKHVSTGREQLLTDAKLIASSS